MRARSHGHQQRGVVKFPNQPITMMRRVVPSVRAGTQERGDSAWHMPVSINGKVVDAVVDTAAEITIISQRLFKSLKPRPGGCKEMNVRLAGDGASMAAGCLSEVEIGIGEYHCHHPVYVAALQDSMLLSIDFLTVNHICLSGGSGEFLFNGFTEANRMHKPNPEVRVNAVSVKRLRVPPLSAQVIEGELDAKFGHFLLEPLSAFPDGFLFAKSLNSSGERGKICVINMTRCGQIIKSGQLIGQAVQVVTPPSVTDRQVQPSVGGDPSHIAPLLDDLRAHSPREIVGEAIALVKEYADVLQDLTLTLVNHCVRPSH